MNDKSNLNLAFSTPIWASLLPDYRGLNEIMFKYIKNLQSKNPDGVSKSNQMGWHSENFDIQSEEPKLFIKAISPNLKGVLVDMGWDLSKNEIKITSMWSIVNYKNASNSRHIHSNNYISAAYYVRAPKDCGNIVFHDPRSESVYMHPKISETNKLNSNIFSIEPQEGLLVLFPSFLHHSVNINNSDEERIVISFNINLI